MSARHRQTRYFVAIRFFPVAKHSCSVSLLYFLLRGLSEFRFTFYIEYRRFLDICLKIRFFITTTLHLSRCETLQVKRKLVLNQKKKITRLNVCYVTK